MRPSASDSSVDGRRARREQNVDAVIDAALDLLAEGDPRPGAAAIAERSGMSVRSLFRYFEDLDELFGAAVRRQGERADDLFEPLVPAGGTDERIERLVAHRLELHDRIGAVLRAARTWAPHQPTVAAALSRRRRQLRTQLEVLFAEELAATGRVREPTLSALELVTGPEALEALRHDRRMSAARAAEVLRRGVAALLAPP